MNEPIPAGVLALIAELETRVAALENKPPILTKPDLDRFKKLTRKDDGS